MNILNCVDITGYYQYESIYLPIYFYLRDCNADLRFGVEVKDFEIDCSSNQRFITGLYLTTDGLEFYQRLGSNDIVIANLGSTVSGSAVGTHYTPALIESIRAADMLDQNWSTWLALQSQSRDFGDPYSFCTHQSQSILGSFTITTEEPGFFETVKMQSRCTSEAGAFIIFKDSHWGIRLCIPAQPVFSTQPRYVRVLWGTTLYPERTGNYVKKQMVNCSGAEILTELFGHLDLAYGTFTTRTVLVVPRVMPRMSALQLTRAPNNRPRVNPPTFANIALVGHFVEIPRRACVDLGYELRAAQLAVSHLMDYDIPTDSSESLVSTITKVLFWK